jgi:hypothetical protein
MAVASWCTSVVGRGTGVEVPVLVVLDLPAFDFGAPAVPFEATAALAFGGIVKGL